jgi:hypothetical protein
MKMSWENRALEAEADCQCYLQEAKIAAIAGQDHSEALRKLDAALHELRSIEDQARFLANLFGCELNDVWETIHRVACAYKIDIENHERNRRDAANPEVRLLDIHAPPKVRQMRR